MNLKNVVLAAGLALLSVGAADGAVLNPAPPTALTAPPTTPQPLTPVPIRQVQIYDAFWTPRLKLWREVTLLDCWTKFENDRGGAINNFDRVRDGKLGEHAGPEWYDGLIYEMIRASADFLAAHPDPKLQQRVEGYVGRIAAAAARDPDGYLETWTQLMAPAHRWGLNGGNDVSQHDLYNAGALIDAGVHWYRATGKTDLLQVAVRMANLMCATMGPAPRINQVPGHPLGEEALVGLYLLFQEQPQLKARLSAPVHENDYLQLAQFWIDNRGNHQGRPLNWGAYAQDDKPVSQQDEMEGHAVRSALLCAGIAAAAPVAHRADYLAAARRLWNNMAYDKTYVTGGLGSTADGEAFGPDYDLPNQTAYTETCAAVAGAFFDQNMALNLADARYADAVERELYNGALVGVSLDGTHYFYDNPLQVDARHERWSWHGCPCCPPMFLKLMSSLPGCIYAQAPGALYVNQFIGSRAAVHLDGTLVQLRQTTRCPWEGSVTLTVNPERATPFALYVRLPGWCPQPQIAVNGHPLSGLTPVRGYARLQRLWKPGDAVTLTLPMPVQRVKANPRVEADAGRLALQRGPVVYCLEAVDNRGHVRNLVIPPQTPLRVQWRPAELGGVNVIQGPALALQTASWPADSLYLPADRAPRSEVVQFTAIPYFAQANRQPGEMEVWVAEEPGRARPLAPPTLASRAHPSASHCFGNDTVDALNDQVEPASSDDSRIPRFTWWDHRGTAEWVQYDFDTVQRVSAVDVYWWDERRIGAQCRVPQSWRVLYQVNGVWKPVSGATPPGAGMDQFNRVTFSPVQTRALRLEVQLQPGWSGGILEWKVE